MAARGGEVARAEWTDEMKEALIDAMLHEVQTENFTDAGFKTPAWNRITLQVNSKLAAGRPPLNKAQVQSKHKELNGKYQVFVWLLAQSGFGQDPVTGAVTAPPEVWDALLARTRKNRALIQEFRDRPLHRREDMIRIFGERVAIGRYAAASAPVRAPVVAAAHARAPVVPVDPDLDQFSGSEGDEYPDGGEHINVGAPQTAEREAPSPAIHTPVQRDASGGSASKRQRRISPQEMMIQSLNNLAQRRSPLQMALEVFGRDFGADLTPQERLRVRQHLTKPGQAEVFLASSGEDRAVYVEVYKDATV